MTGLEVVSLVLVACLIAWAGWTARPQRGRALIGGPTGPKRDLTSPRTAVPVGVLAGRLLVLLGLVVDFRLGIAIGVALMALPRWRHRRAQRSHNRQVVSELPEVVDFLHVAVSSGLTVGSSIQAVGDRLPGEIAAAFRRVGNRTAMGARLEEELLELPSLLGEPIRPVVRALRSAERFGVPIAQSLEKLAREVRVERRRRAEIAARRVPVTLLFPLVGCTLPAFVLLTVVPVLAVSLTELGALD